MRYKKPNEELEFYKERRKDKTLWVDNRDTIGEYEFTYDKNKIYNLFEDYPHNMTPEDVETFSKENPYWRDFFADRFT